MQEEIWKDIKSYEKHYQVSNYGRVKSLDRVNFRGNKIKGRILKTASISEWYLTVSLWLNGKQKTKKVHQLVAESFFNHTPNGNILVVDHIDNDKSNNKLSNLQIISNRENSSKDRKLGTSKYIGVSFSLRENKYKAQCYHNGKLVYLGLFSTEIEASYVYNNFLKSITQ